MTWESFEPKNAGKISIGDFVTRDFKDSTSFVVPKIYEGMKSLIFIDKKRQLVKVEFGDKGRGKGTLGTNWIIEVLGEDSAVVYYDETALYMCPYSRGEEYMKKCLKELQVKI